MKASRPASPPTASCHSWHLTSGGVGVHFDEVVQQAGPRNVVCSGHRAHVAETVAAAGVRRQGVFHAIVLCLLAHALAQLPEVVRVVAPEAVVANRRPRAARCRRASLQLVACQGQGAEKESAEADSVTQSDGPREREVAAGDTRDEPQKKERAARQNTSDGPRERKRAAGVRRKCAGMRVCEACGAHRQKPPPRTGRAPQ